MDACTASTLRWILLLVVAVMAAMGLWSLNATYACPQAPDPRKCTLRAFTISAGVIAAGIFLTTLVITHKTQAESAMPSTTDLVQNLA